LAACLLGLAALEGGTGVAHATAAGPALLEADAVDAGHVELAWTAVPGASQYTAYRDGVALSAANTLHVVDTSAAAGTAHSYAVTATVGGVETGPSPAQAVSVPAAADTQAPTTPSNLHATSVAATSATLGWQASTDDVGVIGYFLRAGPVLYSYTEGSLSTNVPYLKASTTYTFTLTAMDASGKQSAPTQVTFTTAPLGTSDTVAPATPSLTATPYSASEVDLSWTKPSDSDLTGFLVFQGSQLLEDIPPNSSVQTRVLPVTGLSAQTSYTFSVRSYDAAGNQSSPGVKTVTTLAATDVRVARGPYVQRADTDSARVVWRTNIAAPSNLSYSDGTSTTTVVDAAPRTDHSVLIGPLPSLSRITYTLNYPTAISGNFQTCSGSPATLHLDAVGDMGGGATPEKDIANLVAGDHPDLIAAMGDDVYPTGLDKDYPARLFVPYAAAMRGSAYVTTFGNHEYYSPGAADAHRAYSQPGNESYFSFDCSGVHFTVLDAYQPYGPGSTQYQWLANDLAATTQPWKIAVIHVPAYSSSVTGPYPGSAGVLNPLFEQYHVQLVLAGHSHNYERTNVINGVTYMVDGGGGNGIN
jgi:chitodextrinase